MIQKLYLNDTASVRTPIAAMKQLSYTYGTAINSSTKIANTASQTTQFIPSTANNNTAFTIGTTPDAKGWIFESGLVGRYWPGSWTVQAYIAASNSLAFNNETGSLSAKIFVVTPTATTVTLIPAALTSTFTTAAQTLSANNFTFTANLTVNNFFYVYANQYVYVELYWTLANNLFTTTAALWLESPNTFITTSFFEELR